MLICAESRTQDGGQTDDRHTDHSQQEAAGVRREIRKTSRKGSRKTNSRSKKGKEKQSSGENETVQRRTENKVESRKGRSSRSQKQLLSGEQNTNETLKKKWIYWKDCWLDICSSKYRADGNCSEGGSRNTENRWVGGGGTNEAAKNDVLRPVLHWAPAPTLSAGSAVSRDTELSPNSVHPFVRPTCRDSLIKWVPPILFLLHWLMYEWPWSLLKKVIG